ncbi:TorF family putative porin [Altererythrobacter sp. KTW20L]|uniref:TorF family putative porin n=1 Tax=Altererythrobacter sp. KTW20L TaxID=2942210 RepID=UPI0020BEC593|nr:TorF family putative porin [Altererythrobacter sp. KTW20L]MCL6250923.1 TorF family putative porin [Altererythrobacter sp. KTW20L]
MLTSVRSLMAATLLAGSVFVAAPAAAQDIEISGNASIVSQYRFRGVDLSGGDPAIQGGIDFGLPSGFYVGTWGSSLDENTVGFGHTELDIYGGWSSEIAPGVTFDVGGLYYLFPNAGPGDFDYYELYTSLGFEFGPAGLEVGVAYSPKQDSLGGTDNFYIYTDVGVGIPDSPISINAHLGYTDGFLTYTANSKAWDYSIGVDVALTENLSVGAAYMDAEGNSAPYNFVDDAFVVTLGVSF